MPRVDRLPGSLMELPEEFRPYIIAPTFTTFALLTAGMIARPAARTVCGMQAGAGLARVWRHSRAHRFFAAAAWSADAVGLVVLWLVTGRLIPVVDILYALKIDAPPPIYQLKPPRSPDGTDPAA
jgi:hypothetical protein